MPVMMMDALRLSMLRSIPVNVELEIVAPVAVATTRMPVPAAFADPVTRRPIADTPVDAPSMSSAVAALLCVMIPRLVSDTPGASRTRTAAAVAV